MTEENMKSGAGLENEKEETVDVETKNASESDNLKNASDAKEKVEKPVSPKICKNCSSLLTEDERFCPTCGAEYKEEIPGEKVKRVCNNCGAEIPIEAAFCMECGTPYQEQPKVIFCKNCGAELSPDKKFCGKCGTPIVIQQRNVNSQNKKSFRLRDFGGPNAKNSPIQYMLLPLKKYATFKGRSRRAEYWWFMLAVGVAIYVICPIIGYAISATIASILYGAISLGCFIPTLAAGWRRMHDVGKSGAYLLIPIYNIILACKPGVVGPNQYGPDPKQS